RVVECKKQYAARKHPSRIELLLLGEPLQEAVIENARAQLNNFGLEHAELVVRQVNKPDGLDVNSLQQSYMELLAEKNRRIEDMRTRLERYRVTDVEVDDISREMGALMPDIATVSLTKGVTFDGTGTPRDTTLICVVSPLDPQKPIDRTTLERWLRVRTKVNEVQIFIK
ncbi:MAG: TIGR00341 family protein, partial [Alistipes sp.]|nr:TIGR00341 family protein [Alistipes sp.]